MNPGVVQEWFNSAPYVSFYIGKEKESSWRSCECCKSREEVGYLYTIRKNRSLDRSEYGVIPICSSCFSSILPDPRFDRLNLSNRYFVGTFDEFDDFTRVDFVLHQ